MQILFTDRVLLTIMRMDQILGGQVSPSPYLDQKLWQPMHLFRLDSALTGFDTEFAGRSSAE